MNEVGGGGEVFANGNENLHSEQGSEIHVETHSKGSRELTHLGLSTCD